ncbi:hypothetical protein J7E88_07460 [Streptomyces sp. ISL-10]|nr:hypothetical protein [Streptomyces sp. ISL-10]MBT2365158.1 hypothetical protein [Streptomyces sp. ISL-10]
MAGRVNESRGLARYEAHGMTLHHAVDTQEGHSRGSRTVHPDALKVR